MSSSMSMPMKRATPTSMATPSPTMKVTSPMRGEKKPEQMKAEKMMMLYVFLTKVLRMMPNSICFRL